tara:strand:- start:141 stop:2255 length:2115 start_codon:yes stop_codon:yes gene_type:complete
MARYTKTGTPSKIGQVDANLDLISTAITDTLSRKGDAPNQMEAPLDMNNNSIINLPPPATPNSPARLADLAAAELAAFAGLNLQKEFSYAIGAGQTLASVSLDAFNSSYFISTPDSLGGKLILNTDYVVVSGSQIQFLNTFPANSILTEVGIATDQSVVDRDATAISKYFKAEDFGFTHVNSGADNLVALTAAYNACNEGGIVTINQAENFSCNRFDVVDGKEFGIELNGTGKWQLATSRAVSIIQAFTDTRSVSSIVETTHVVNGSTCDVVRLTVSSSTPYAKGDVVRIFSADLDAFDGRSNRRKGEFAEVIDVASGFVYLTCKLEDTYDTSNNTRIMRMTKKSFSFKGKFLSSISNVSEVLQLEGIYKPNITLDVENHGKIVVNLKAAYMGNFYLSGSGYADNGGSLGYLANDAAGYHNVYHAPFGKFFRHVITSNATSVVSTDNAAEDFGPTRGMTVRDGISIGAQGAPWDDHDGARRSQFINCKSLNPLRSAAAYPCTFQLRGRDTKIVGGETVGPTQTFSNDYAHIRFGTTASGHIQINNTTCVSQRSGLVFIAPPTSNAVGSLSVSVNGGNIRLTQAQSLVAAQHMNMQITGTTIESLGASADFTQLFDVTDAKLYLSNVTVKVTGTGGSARAVRLNTNGKVMGQFYLDVSGVTYTAGVLSESTGNSSFLTLVNAGGSAGSLANSGSFDFVSNTIVTL